MSDFLEERIKKTELTKSQKKIAEYFLQNQTSICNMSSLEVAGAIGVSDASVIRFSRAIGFEGFSDLKEQLYEELIERGGNRISLSQRLSRNLEKYQGSDVESFLGLVQKNVEGVFNNNAPEELEKLSGWLTGASQRYVVGMRGCRGLAIKFGRLLSFMLPGVRTLTDGECTSIYNLQDITDKDVLVMYVLSRFYKIDLNYVKMARQRGAKICLMIDEITGPLTAYADMVIRIPTANSSFYHSTIGAELVSEYVLNLVSRKVDFKERIDERDAAISDQRL